MNFDRFINQKMLGHLLIFTRGGLILWSYSNNALKGLILWSSLGMHMELRTLLNSQMTVTKKGENDHFVVASNVNGYNLKINGSGIVSVNGKDKDNDNDNDSANNVAFDVNCYS
ncbi:hypothetical protein MtrunA17_Chr8g0348561 [Medicago truncatula]|nr:hypothetical protein MtrunA17_Chr8g0348561 [Medicago truncatula]